MEEYATNQQSWIDDFTKAYEKFSRNGYPDGLTNGPDTHSSLVCPVPKNKMRWGEYVSCYQLDSYDAEAPTFMIGNRKLDGKARVFILKVFHISFYLKV